MDAILKLKALLLQMISLKLSTISMPSKKEQLCTVAKLKLGRDASPDDLAPDEVGCAESVNEIHKATFGDYISNRNILSTYQLYGDLRHRTDFVSVSTPTKGTIVISPTGYGKGSGHVGIYDGQMIMSNDSRTGTFEANYTLESWIRYFRAKRGFPVHYFDKV